MNVIKKKVMLAIKPNNFLNVIIFIWKGIDRMGDISQMEGDGRRVQLCGAVK